ncbi:MULTISPECIES: hypothetical protein [unclassified Synechococcus]|jgi:hypothetical protein|uniref:hypothetical protein n=1 Tax=unclassified Synechococcus TaxID=2626047 RepID=UPI000069933A|nr:MULTISPECIES: hypothetical protein [unclassified Synechococcus]EAQ76249.1 hypothetical protein WH5701_15621 [Synechococcus sp. WH 5701]WFN58944.1 hypothetical protein N4320_14415 [Synechococcus sp. CCFWC 502]
MTTTRKTAALLAALALAGSGPLQTVPGQLLNALVPPAQARVGRPLTPVSVAGVGRRTVRRCAVGVYDC